MMVVSMMLMVLQRDCGSDDTRRP